MNENFCERIGCNSCKWGALDECKRECSRLKLSKPTFKCNRFDSLRFCSDYEPCSFRVKLMENWQGFEDWYEKYKRDWDDGPIENKTMTFVLDGNEKVRYHVKLSDFIWGDLVDERGNFKAIFKQYYKRSNNGCGYKLVTEELNGLEV